MKRLFIAIPVEFQAKTIEHINDIKDELWSEKIRWVDTGNVHLTLKFLGDTPEELIDEIDASLNEIVENFSATSLNINGLGVFPNIHRPRVIWLGLSENEILSELYAQIEKQMQVLGFEPENRPFSPHLTLGRVKFLHNIRQLDRLIAKYKNFHFQDLPVKKVILYESILRPQGPLYTALGTYNLQ